MIRDVPLIRPLGDRYLSVEFGDEADLRLNFRVLALAEQLGERPVRGVLQVVPSFRQLALVVDREQTSLARVTAAIEELLAGSREQRSVRTRCFRLPVWYDDPWSADTAERFGVRRNIEIVAEHNGTDVPGVIERHTATEYWVACVGFMPGGHFGYPLDLAPALSAPKYTTPRDWTPARTLSIAGLCCATYASESPGGYQLIGRLPVDVYQAHPTHRIFPPDGVLFRAGDRKSYRSVDPDEYRLIREAFKRGTYEYDVAECDFDIAKQSRLIARQRGAAQEPLP